MNAMNITRDSLYDNENNGDRLIASSKSGFFYYLLMILMPIMFLVMDGIDNLTQLDFTDANDIGLAVFATAFFFLAPGALWLLRVETKVYNNRVLRRNLSLKRERVYYFKDLMAWYFLDKQPMARDSYITLKFPETKVRLSKLGTLHFDCLKLFLENNYPNRHKMPWE